MVNSDSSTVFDSENQTKHFVVNILLSLILFHFLFLTRHFVVIIKKFPQNYLWEVDVSKIKIYDMLNICEIKAL